MFGLSAAGVTGDFILVAAGDGVLTCVPGGEPTGELPGNGLGLGEGDPGAGAAQQRGNLSQVIRNGQDRPAGGQIIKNLPG